MGWSLIKQITDLVAFRYSVSNRKLISVTWLYSVS